MKAYKILLILGILTTHLMCIHISFSYCDMLWGIKMLGYSAPANIVFILAIPYSIVAIPLFIGSYILYKKNRAKEIMRQKEGIA